MLELINKLQNISEANLIKNFKKGKSLTKGKKC